MDSVDETDLPISLDHETTRRKLLDAAEDVFAHKGYEAASVREICSKAGVRNIGAVNYYFQGKERLYIETVKQAFGACTEGAPFPEWLPELSAAERLKSFIRVMITRMLDIPRPSAMIIMTREMAQPTDACREAVRANIEPMAHMLRSILKEMLPQLSDDHIWMIGFSIVGQTLFYRQSRVCAEMLMGTEAFARLTVDKLAEHIIQFSLAALGTDRPISTFTGVTE